MTDLTESKDTQQSLARPPERIQLQLLPATVYRLQYCLTLGLLEKRAEECGGRTGHRWRRMLHRIEGLLERELRPFGDTAMAAKNGHRPSGPDGNGDR